MNNNFAVTYGKNCKGSVVSKAKSWAEELNIPFVLRDDSRSLEIMLKDLNLDALLISTEEGPQIYSEGGVLFFHPSMSTLRKLNLERGEIDHFAAATELKSGMKYLDCTLGLATDAIIAAYLVGTTGKVTGVEASKLIHFMTKQGLENYSTKDADINVAMKKIETVNMQAKDYLQNLPDDSFDVIYFDPMFRFPVKGSSNMLPLRPIAYEKPLDKETVLLALKKASRVVIKERGEGVLKELGASEIFGGKYSKVKFGVVKRN